MCLLKLYLTQPLLKPLFFSYRQSSVAPFSTRNSSLGATGSASSTLTSAHRSSPTIPSSSSTQLCGSNGLVNMNHNNQNNNLVNLSSTSGNNGGYSSDGDSDEE